jgi:hypothetical protein
VRNNELQLVQREMAGSPTLLPKLCDLQVKGQLNVLALSSFELVRQKLI